ncbi:EcKinase 13, partial [Microplitis demolitor]
MAQPEWLTARFLERVLRNADKDDSISVTEISVTNATNKGDNYTSDMFRVTFELIRNETGMRISKKNSIIVKAALSSEGIHKDLIEDAKIFENEIKMMTSTLKDMESVLKDTKLGGRCYYAQLKDPTLLVIEDLAPLGFRMADRQLGLDLQHCTLALQRLAKFHASSVLVCENKPKYKKDHSKGMFSSDFPPDAAKFFTDSINSMVKAAETWSELSVECREKLRKLSNTLFPKACEIAKLNESEFNVLNHGDYWVNNMLFKYNDRGNVVDHVFVDFQMCNYGTPAIDLQYFFNTSASEEVLALHKDSLFDEYVKVLSTTMKNIGCKTCPPSLSYIKNIFSELEIIGLVVACTALPIMMTDKSQAKDHEELVNTSAADFNADAYKNKAYQLKIVPRLLEWNARGILD